MLALWVGGQVFIPRPALCRVSVLRGLQSFLDLHAVPLWLQFKIWLGRADGGLVFLKTMEELNWGGGGACEEEALPRS